MSNLDSRRTRRANIVPENSASSTLSSYQSARRREPSSANIEEDEIAPAPNFAKRITPQEYKSLGEYELRLNILTFKKLHEVDVRATV